MYASTAYQEGIEKRIVRELDHVAFKCIRDLIFRQTLYRY